MKRKVLVSAPYFQPVIERFRPEFEKRGLEIVIPQVHERLSEGELLDVIADIEGVLCGDDAFTPRVLAQAKKLKVISKWGTGIDSIDQVACKDCGVRVCNTPNAFTIPVADTTIGYALAFVRNFFPMDKAMKNGVWDKVPGKTLSECTVGLIGVGNIGSAVARRLRAFGPRLLGTDPRGIAPDLVAETNIQRVDLDTLLRESDIVSVHCDLNPTSRGMLNLEKLSLTKKNSYLINTARGPIIKEADLCALLEKGHFAGVGLDVFEVEPLPSASPLKKYDRVLIAPHNSNSSPAAWERVHLNTMRQLFECLGVP
jgi:D-3-phosphoglycerate dehydrogenase